MDYDAPATDESHDVPAEDACTSSPRSHQFCVLFTRSGQKGPMERILSCVQQEEYEEQAPGKVPCPDIVLEGQEQAEEALGQK